MTQNGYLTAANYIYHTTPCRTGPYQLCTYSIFSDQYRLQLQLQARDRDRSRSRGRGRGRVGIGILDKGNEPNELSVRLLTCPMCQPPRPRQRTILFKRYNFILTFTNLIRLDGVGSVSTMNSVYLLPLSPVCFP